LTRIYFDTEFTGLSHDAKPISIGLVDESGNNEFYAELSDTYRPEDCSEFCASEVLPHLEGGAVAMSVDELRRRLPAWLHERGAGAVLVCDSHRDVGQLDALLPDGLPPNVEVRVLGWWGNLKRRVKNRGRRIHRAHGLRVHHALDDARVNRIVLA
jgi:hypothetical protein